MEFLTEKYTIIIFIGLFIVFALVGYLIELTKKNKETIESNEKEVEKIPDEEEKILEISKEEKIEEKETKDELLKDYNDLDI